jgi:hypothetical protein
MLKYLWEWGIYTVSRKLKKCEKWKATDGFMDGSKTII